MISYNFYMKIRPRLLGCGVISEALPPAVELADGRVLVCLCRQEREREQQEREQQQQEWDRSRELELHRERELEVHRERDREMEMKRQLPGDLSPQNKRTKSEDGDNKIESMPHTKMSISSKR